MQSVKDLDVGGKKALVRVDLNSSAEGGKIQITPRMKAHSKTLEYLSDKGAKVIVLAHQGRPGRDDFLHLDQHAQRLEELMGRKVGFVKSICGPEAKESIEGMEPGDILVLDNVRMHGDELKKVSPEEHAKSELVTKLSGWCDLYVNDAFSVCHRNQASMTGFPQVMDSCVGLQLKKDLDALGKLDNPPRPLYFVVGGNKPGDAADILLREFERGGLEKALVGGAVGEAFLQVKGVDLGPKHYDLGDTEEKMEKLLDEHGDSIVLPVDVAYSDGSRKEISVDNLPIEEKIFDIGSSTVGIFKEELKKAKTVVFNGPLGKFEDPEFMKGTKEILKALKGQDSFTLVGGGDTSNVLDELGYDLENDFSHVSLAGGAFVSYISGKKLPGIEALK